MIKDPPIGVPLIIKVKDRIAPLVITLQDAEHVQQMGEFHWLPNTGWNEVKKQ